MLAAFTHVSLIAMNPTLLEPIRALLCAGKGLAAFLDEIPLGVAVLDPRGRTALVNRAFEAITGVDRAEVAGLQCLHALRCNFCVLGCPVQAGEKSFESVGREADIISRDRRKIPIRLTVSALTAADGSNAGFLETVENLEQSRGVDAPGRAYKLDGIIGKSPGMEKIFRMVPSVGQTDSSVLITGETGTGKDLLAAAIHKESDRSRGPFIKVNCGALPDALLESELFGHARGAFTGADQSKPGRIRMAHGGTLFLTEVGDLPFKLQVKLLSFLDDKVIHPLGGEAGFSADVRIICATHRDLEDMARRGRFRQDLLFRLNVIRFHLPPLRDRGEDAILLKGHFLRELSEKFQKDIHAFSDGATRLMAAYSYPGNVRELRNIVEYAANFCSGKTIHTRHLPAYLTEASAFTETAGPGPLPVAGTGPSQGDVSSVAVAFSEEGWEAAEKRLILEALVRAGGRKGRAAEILGWGRSTMWRKLKHHGISR